MSLSDEDIAEVRARASLYDLISATVPLRRSGSQWKGLCPFHDEKTPSFTVKPAQGFYYCFGCLASGDAITWVQYAQSLNFPDAVRWLADQTGIQLRESDTPSEGPPRRLLFEALAAAQTQFAEQLDTDAASPARHELASRHFTVDQARRHGCGYAPRGGALPQNYSREVLAGAGITGPKGRPFFQGRLTWPLADHTGRTVGFAARKLYDGDAQAGKYVNSPGGPLFHKKDLLYWLHQAKRAAAESGRIFVVEGYTDVMACDAAGIVETVAACGTAFGESHLRLLRRTCPDARIVYCFDGDDAGREATTKAWRVSAALLEHCWTVRLPAGQDPCDLRVASGDEALREALSQPRPLTEVVLEDQLADVAPAPEAKAIAAQKAVDLLSAIPDLVLRAEYLPLAAKLVGVPPALLQAKLDGGKPAAPPTPPPGVLHPSLDRTLLTLILTHPEWSSFWGDALRNPDLFTTSRGREIALRAAETDPRTWPHSLVTADTSEETRSAVFAMMSAEPHHDDQTTLADVIRRCTIAMLTAQSESLTRALDHAEPDHYDKLLDDLLSVTDQLRALRQ